MGFDVDVDFGGGMEARRGVNFGLGGGGSWIGRGRGSGGWCGIFVQEDVAETDCGG